MRYSLAEQGADLWCAGSLRSTANLHLCYGFQDVCTHEAGIEHQNALLPEVGADRGRTSRRLSPDARPNEGHLGNLPFWLPKAETCRDR